MKEKELHLVYDEYSSPDECPTHIQNLYKRACLAAEKAYAPFSHFRVGVAIELEDGSIYEASNQENKAYPSGLCAERAGLFYVNANKPDIPVVRIVIVAFDSEGMIRQPVYPCGACRQVMMESQDRGGKDIETWMFGSDKVHKTKSVDVLLPLRFTLINSVDQ